ncbi:uncharacterized protein A4U43_C03F20140 [Asparagus officinalis]|uniref:TCP domain-containing protein n=1 Tax=Asparagus officinalis TaxID=4686 RepID=A0A5P1FGQ2_ASPOF|nr:transcription factor TCP17-like [Asparagus officinalis]XP_020257579.1 transcription factor TCP17-like [Asparagus officinalis]ONK75750.1 uncharacterized protein A4U43_C03F20140 [Asparagus officinalis]
MIRNQSNKDLSTKQEGNHKAPPTSSRILSALRNPRIVRVSREFGGKDRHSKVSTVRGLRDRRVRLSVPTAIQLYDLQDRLGLNQPSKVVDWLINKAQHEINKLPPLKFPPQGLNQGDGDHSKGNDIVNAQVLSHEVHQRDNSSYYQLEAINAYLSQHGIRSSQSNEAHAMVFPSMFQSHSANPMMDFNAKEYFNEFEMARSVSQMPQSNMEINSVHLNSSQPRSFQ